MHVKTAERQLGATIPWLCDSISNDLKHALGGAPNSEFVFDPQGKIVKMNDWSNPSRLRQDLIGLVGDVSKPTNVADLNLKTQRKAPAAARGVVPRIQVPSGLQAVKIEPKVGKKPYYAKLRAEVDSQLLRSGSGKLYLGFHMDPIYNVHWNNLVKPIQYEITAADGVKVSPATGQGPKVKEEADIDPREFLVDIEGARTDKPIALSVKYFACNDDEGWCVSVTQEYAIFLERDRDAGSPRRGGGRGGSFAGRGGGGFGGRPGGGSPRGVLSVDLIMRYDRNDDGKVSKTELPEFMTRILDRADTNSDGAIDRKEAEAMVQRIRSFGQRSRRPDR